MAEGGHVIGKSVFVIDVPAKSQADRCFAAISRAFQDMLPEHLPSLFDELQTGDIHLRIDRLVIDLGTLTEAELSNNLTEILLVALKEQLKKYLSSGAVYPYLTERANIEYFLRYYFSKGRYPWWANELMAARSPAEWLYEYVKGNEAEGEALIKAILRDPVSQKRLSLQKDFHRLNLPEVSLDIWNPPPPSDYAVSHQYKDEWLWYFLELGRFPTGMVPVSVYDVIALLLQVTREKPENSLSRMREITLRRPWSLSRLTQLADTEVLQELVGLWSGTPLEEIKTILSEWGESQFSEKEIWKEVLYWLASEPESVHGQMPAFMRSLTAKQATELPVDSSDGSSDYAGNVWHFIEYGRFPDGISRISMAGFTAELKTEFDTAPLLSASRLREIFRRRPWALSRLVRLADEKLLCLIASLLSGIPEAELNRYVSSWRVTGSLEKELWTEVLERIRSEYSSATVRKKDLFAAALSADSAALQPNEMASLVNPDEAAWIYLETGIQPRTTGGKMAHSVFLMKYAERQPLLFLARLREIENISSGVVGRLIHLYRPKELFRLISVLSGTAKRNIEAWLKGFAGSDPESLLSKEQIGEILEWLMIQPSSQSVKLREILSAAVPGVSRESMKSADNREPSTEEQVWYYLESGALLPGSGIQTGIRSGDLILRMASRKPVYVLSRLQEMINRNPVVFIRMLGNYKTEVLVRLIRLLAGTRLQALDDIGTKPELLLNGILESAFRWLWNNKISERKNLEDALQDIIGGHIPEKVAGQPQGLSAEDLVWYYLEYGLIPESATGVSVAYLLEVFLKLASEYPALVLARLGEILGRKPWILFRLSLQCTPEYLSRLVAALSGMKGALFDISDRMLHPEMTPQDVWIGFLRWLVDNQFADKERAPEQYLDFISIQEGSESPSMDELVWYYLRYWRLPGRLDGHVVHETELLDRLLDMFDFAPFHTRARMRELALLNTGFLTNLVTRLSDRQRNDLVSRLSGLTTDELSEMTLSVSAAGALRLPVREFWRGVLQWLIFEKLPDDRFRVYLNELVTSLKKPVKTAVISAEASLWNYIESGNLYDFTSDRVRLLLQLAAAYPEQTLFRLAYLTSVRPVLLSSLVLRLNETDLLNLMVVLTGTPPVLLEDYKNSFQTRGIPVRPVLEEILRWLLVSFSGDKKRPDQILHEILIREQPGDSDQEYTLENMFWYLLEYGSLPEKSGIVVSDITVEAQLLTISVRTPLLVLSRLKEISRRSTDNFIRFFVRQNSGYLIQTVSALSGIERRELNVFPAAVSGMTWPESLLKSFWFRALRWLVDKPLTQRSGILDFLQNELDFLLPPVEQQEVLPAPRFSADENIWFFLLTGNSPEGTSPPAADEINRIINKELRETPARLFSKMTEFQRADRHFASRFTEKLSLATLHDTAIILFGCTEESLREIQKTLLSDTSLKRTWVEALRWIVSDFIVRTATGGSRGPLAIKGPELSDYTRLWFYLEFGRFPMYQKLSGKKSPGLLIRKALEDNFLETRNQLREIYQSRTGLVSDINSIFTENDLLLLVTGLLQISVAVWEKGVPAGSGEERYRLSWALRLILAGVADQPDQIMELTRLSEFAYKPDTLAEKYHDPEDQLWYFLEFGIPREQTSRVGRSEMARLLISALAQRRKEVSGRLLKLAQVNRELPLLLSTMFSLQHFWEFLGVWFNSDPDDWQKKWAGKDYLPEYSLQIAGSLLRGRFSRREDVLRWIEEQQSSLYGLPTDVSSIWYFLESGYLPEKEFRLSGRDAVEILISSATPEDLLLQLRRLYHRNSSALLRLLQLTEQSGGDMLVLYLSGANYSQRKELDVLFDTYGRDDSTVNHIMNLALKLLVTRGFQGEKTLTEWVLSEIGTEKRTTDTAGSQTIPAIANQVWRYLETGQFRGYIPELTEQNVQQYFLDGFFRHKDDMVARLRELFRTRPGLVVRLVSVLDTQGLRMALAAILGLDLAAWKVLEDHLVSELRVAPEDLLLTGIRYILKSGSISGEELLSGIFYESGLLSGERVEYRKQPVELFWYYLEFGHYPAGEKSLATKQGNLILEQGINSPDGEFIRRLTAVFKKDSTMLLRLSVISSSELRRRLLLAVMKTDNGTLKQLEKKIWSDSSGKISREEVVTELLRLALSRKALVSDDLIAVSATESGVPASSLPGKSVKSVPDRNQAYLLWYYLEQGQYPPGEEALKGNEAAVLLMNQLSEDAGVVIIRLRELFRYHPALLAHLSGILNITLLRRLVARIINIEESVWIGHEDIIRSVTVTPHNPFRFQTVALSYVLSGSAENLKSLVTLMLNQTGIEEPEILMPTDISSALKSESTSDKEVLSEIFYESGRPAGERTEQRKQSVELFWYYLEFGYYPAGEKSLATKQGNLILEQGINSPDGEFIRRLTAVFKKDSTMLLRLSVISSPELRRGLLLAIMKMDNGALKQLEKKMWSESSGKMSREEVVTELLRRALSREVLVADELTAFSATESGVPASALSGKSVSDRNQAYLLWYYLEQGRYPPGEAALKGNEAAGLLMNQLSEDADGVIIRLRELFRYHPALLVHLSGILNITLLRRLVARIIDIEENVWMIHEDIIRSGTVTPHNPFRFQTAALSYILSGSAENLESLVALMSAQSGLGEPEVTYVTEQYTAEYTIWYFLEYGYYPSESKPVGSEQVFTILRELAGRQAERVAERFRQIYRRNPEILPRMSRIFDSAKLKELLSAILKLNSDDWKRADYQYDIAVSAGFDDDKSLIQFMLKWWLAGEINNEKSLTRILQELVPVQGPYPNTLTDGGETGKSLIWLYLEQGHLPAGNAALTEAELASIIQAAILHDREDTLYRLRDLYRRSPSPVLLIIRMGISVVKSVVAGLLNISMDELNIILKLFPDGENQKDSVTESLLTSVLRMILIGEIKNQSDLKSYASPKTTKKTDNLADISPLYQLWYYLDQGKRLVGSVPRDTMITVLLESASANRTVTLRQLTDLYSQSKGVFIRLLGLLTPMNLNKLVLALLNLDDESWYNTGLSLQDKFPDLPDQNRLLTDLLRGLLGRKLNDKSKITDFLQQLPEYSSDNVPSLTPLYAPESLIWFFLDSGRYPPGVAPMSDEELRSMLLRIVARRPAESLNRLRELYNRRQSLLLTFSRLFKENDLRTLIAGLMHLTDTQWNRMEDELKASTRHSSERLLSGVLRYLLTSNSDSHEDMLQSLASPVNLLPDIAPSKMSEEDYLWYFLEHGRLFDQFSPEIPQLAEKLTSLWRISPERTSVYWRTISARTNLYNRLLQYYSQPVLEQIVGARYENIPVDLDLMAGDLLTFTTRRKKKITIDELWKFIIGLLLPQLDEVRNAYSIFEALIGELAGYYGVSPEKIALFLKDHPQVSQAGQRYALRASGSVTREELGLLTEALENRKPGANRIASDNPFLTLLDTELRTVQELLSGAIWLTDLPDAAGTISWLLRVGRQPTLRMIEKMLGNEWVLIRLSGDMPLEIVELVQSALAGNLWHELLSVRDEALYYFDLLLHERLIRHFNEAFFRVAADTASNLSAEKVIDLFLNRIFLHEHVTVADLVGALKGKNTVGQGVLYRYIRKKYGSATTVKPLLELVREASTRVDEAIYIMNAGLVILHPYLLRYFDMLDLMEGKEFRDGESAVRAVHLLQYLATRQTETPEHLLVLNKILCGLPIDMPVPPGIDITDREREVSESLLKGVLQNWKRMENSSIDNLSGAFLVREGRLLERADRWTLHVKSRAYDILLEFLPWGFSGIKLSWMPKRMEVKWKTKA